MATIKITGKVRVVPAGHKGTSFRDADGNWHAEFFRASVGRVEDDGKYHNYRFKCDLAEAEAFLNCRVGTTFHVELVEKGRRVINENGDAVMVMDPVPSKDGTTLYHDAECIGIEVAKDGFMALPRPILCFLLPRDGQEAKAPDESADA